jgi:hypothetical protein
MKLRIPSRVIESCDLCKYEKEMLLEDCTVCGGRVCLDCSSRPAGFYGESLRICARCGVLTEVKLMDEEAFKEREALTRWYADKLRAFGRRLARRKKP